MKKSCFRFALAMVLVLVAGSAAAQELPALDIRGNVEYDPAKHLTRVTGHPVINYGGAWLTADSVQLEAGSKEVEADGNVRIQRDGQIWEGDHIIYNFETRVIQADSYRAGLFREGSPPLLVSGSGLHASISNLVNHSQSPLAAGTNAAGDSIEGQNTYFTTDDYSDPNMRIRAKRIRIVPGRYVEMWGATVYVESVPVFYFPYYKRNLSPHASNLNGTPGFRSSYGGYLLSTYSWYLNDEVDGKIHLDYRSKRGPAAGPDVNLHLGRWGEANVQYYYQYDVDANYSTNAFPQFGNMPKNRQRLYTGWQATPVTNLNLKALVNYQSDPLMERDFFGGAYDANPQPNTFVEANKYWDNWSLDALAAPRVNDFFSQVERLPDVQLTGFRQEIFDTPFYYDSQSSVGFYRIWDANATNGFYPLTNGVYGDTGMRADTYHQITLPWTFFHWLNVAPRAGGRFTYYNAASDASGRNTDVSRGVFNTGMEVSFKATALWKDAKSSLLQVDGLRHIMEPSVNYVFVPNPSLPPSQLPQYDGEMGALLISPLMFPDYNSIDSIDTMNVMRFGLRNVLQTKRNGQLDDLLNWNLMLDCRLDRQAGQSRLNDLYSQFAIRPRDWLTLEEQLRYDTERGHLNLSFHQVTFTPNDRWSWGVGHLYIHQGTWGLGTWDENSYLTSTAFFRVSDNWGLRAQHNFNVRDGRLQQQYYSVYRDLRSVTAALTFRVQDDVRNSPDYTVALQVSLKLQPNRKVGDDVVNPYRLVGE